jgi:hypothetical protein
MTQIKVDRTHYLTDLVKLRKKSQNSLLDATDAGPCHQRDRPNTIPSSRDEDWKFTDLSSALLATPIQIGN